MNILELLNLSSKKLKYKNIPSYKLDSEILISKIQLIELSKFIVSLFLIFLLTYLLSSFKPKNEFIKIESG